MLYSKKYRFLYVHIAKTGGTSMRAALKSLLWKDVEYYPRWLCHKISSLFAHRLGTKIPRHAHAIAAKEMLPNELYSSLFKFAFVRNPWDLQVSSWHHLRREQPHLVSHCSTFSDFIRFKFDKARPYQYHLDTSIDLQSNYVKDLNGTVLLDFIGRFEHLEEDYHYVCSKLGIVTKKLPEKRKATTRHKDWRTYYDTHTHDLVASYFSEDIRRFGYTFDQ
ncbi:MAG: sulfotransferase family 2 domain-containing protein [Methylacidiphilales bacterium]|nr:sulfotransferase family 2 domain-containing protein [Candidatus Methylacidiphilales bacterium]